MSTFKVTVYQSPGVTNYCDEVWGDPYRSQDKIKSYFEYPNYNDHSISVKKSYEEVPAPTEEIGEPFEAPYPCDRSFTLSYDRLVGWWEDYVDCELNKAQDCDLLITTDSGGGICRDDHYSVASRGHDLAHLPSSIDLTGCESHHGGLQTVMHETGHAFLNKGADWEHNSGYVYEFDDTNHRTPMGHGGDAGENECGYSHPDHTRNSPEDCERLQFYEHCAVDNWVHTG